MFWDCRLFLRSASEESIKDKISIKYWCIDTFSVFTSIFFAEFVLILSSAHQWKCVVYLYKSYGLSSLSDVEFFVCSWAAGLVQGLLRCRNVSKIIKLFAIVFPDVSLFLFPRVLCRSSSFFFGLSQAARARECYTPTGTTRVVLHLRFMVARHKVVAHHRIRYPRYAWISRARASRVAYIYDFSTFLCVHSAPFGYYQDGGWRMILWLWLDYYWRSSATSPILWWQTLRKFSRKSEHGRDQTRSFTQ